MVDQSKEGSEFNELMIRDFQHASDHKGFTLPSSRATIRDPEFGLILCRVNCPVTIVTLVRDLDGTSTRWETTLRLHRPGCKDKIAPCSTAIMLDIVDTAIRSVDVFAADLQPINALMLLLGVELSDIDLFSVNGTVGASHMQTGSLLRARGAQGGTDPLQSTNVGFKARRAQEQDRLRQRFVTALALRCNRRITCACLPLFAPYV